MEKINIDDSLINEGNHNSALFLEYIVANGFNPNSYGSIWEFSSCVKESMSQFLK